MAPTAAMRHLGIDLPIVLAPMGGGPSTVELAAAVSNAGALGSLAGGYLPPDALRDAIRAMRAATAGPFAVNLFVPTDVDPPAAAIETVLRRLEPLRLELGLPGRPEVTRWREEFDEQAAVVVAERVPVFSFTFGVPSPAVLDAVRSTGAVTVGTATNVAEAVALERAGVDLVCAQGAEAGGHHGSWLAAAEDSLIGTLGLVPQVCDAVDVPVIAAGGVMDGRGVAAVLCLGAGAAQMGTAFMLCPEAGTSAPHRRAMAQAAATDVVTTSSVTGRLARGVGNRLMRELAGTVVPPYPVMNALTSELRRAATIQDNPDLMSLWCGQGAALAHSSSAGALVDDIITAVQSTAAELSTLMVSRVDHHPEP